ncbi:MAG: helix-hairpin-helix domain-containing protein [Acidobacteriota bacterium]
MNRFASRLGVALLALVVLTVGMIPPLSAAEENNPIDLNRATARELIQLPGVGEVIAKRIVDFREEHGPFKRVEDLMKVKGIGEKSLEKIRPYIRIGKDK